VPKAKSFICSLSVRRHQIISALGRCKNDYTNPETTFSDFVQWDYWPASTGSLGTGVPVVTGRAAAVDLIRSSLANAKSAHQVHTADRAERRRGRRRLGHAGPGDAEGRTGVDRPTRLIGEFPNALLTAFVVLRSQADVLGAEDPID
jgi:hypothetical protein